MSRKIVVIGSGSAGLVCAIGLVQIGYDVTVVEKYKIGGDCTNFGCVPSKTLLHAARHFADSVQFMKHAGTEISPQKMQELANEALQQTRDIRAGFQAHESPEWLAQQNIKFVHGTATFTSPHTLNVENTETTTELEFDTCIIATGSRAFVPPIEGISDGNFLTNETVFELKNVPRTMAILGNGPIGIEMAQAFSNLGSKITVIGLSDTILPRSDAELAQKLQALLAENTVEFMNAQTTQVEWTKQGATLHFANGKTLEVEQLLVATGRVPNVELNLEAAGIDFSQKGIHIQPNGRTTQPHIFAVGDCVENMPQFTHVANFMAKKLVSNFIIQKYTRLPILPFRVQPTLVPAVTFSDIELAEAGLTESQARNQFGTHNVEVYSVDFADVDRALTHNAEPGMIKIITTGFWGRIVGVHILATRAGEILPEMQMWVQKKLPIRKILTDRCCVFQACQI